MSHQPSYEFGSYRLDVAERLLLRDGESVLLQPKVFDLLLVLVEQHGHLLDKEELMKRVWPDTIVEEANLTNNISILRKTLGENGERFIETVPKRGYRFVAPVRELETPTEAVTLDAAPTAPATSGWLAHRWLKPGLAAAMLLLLLVGLVSAFNFWAAQRQTTASIAAIKSIAVLPVRPLHHDKNDEYLGIGLADAVITRLSSTGKIIVRPTSAITRYADGEQDPLAAGREQQVEAVLESSLWRSGEKIRLTARLLNVQDGKALWSYSCEELCTDVFAVQTLISSQMAAALLPQLTGAEKSQLTKQYTNDPEANRLYMLGRHHWNRRTKEDHQKGIAYFEQAVAKDPNFALAYAGMAECYFAGGGPLGDTKENRRKAKAYVERALALDSTLVEAQTTLAGITFASEWDYTNAERRFKQVLETYPNDANAHRRYSLFLMCRGRTEESLTEIKRAIELDPASPSINTSLGLRLYFARRYEQALEQFQKTLELEPQRFGALLNIGEVYLQKGQYAEAITALRKAAESSADDDAEARLGYAYANAGQPHAARQILTALQSPSRQHAASPVNIGLLYVALGEKEQALIWLEKAWQERADKFWRIKVDPLFDPLRDDPRFQDLLRRAGLSS
jgi:DNA-binding winged helix-turn-helix (wHTH) protein/tetratricopeptide (TPR) repeat protein